MSSDEDNQNGPAQYSDEDDDYNPDRGSVISTERASRQYRDSVPIEKMDSRSSEDSPALRLTKMNKDQKQENSGENGGNLFGTVPDDITHMIMKQAQQQLQVKQEENKPKRQSTQEPNPPKHSQDQQPTENQAQNKTQQQHLENKQNTEQTDNIQQTQHTQNTQPNQQTTQNNQDNDHKQQVNDEMQQIIRRLSTEIPANLELPQNKQEQEQNRNDSESRGSERGQNIQVENEHDSHLDRHISQQSGQQFNTHHTLTQEFDNNEEKQEHENYQQERSKKQQQQQELGGTTNEQQPTEIQQVDGTQPAEQLEVVGHHIQPQEIEKQEEEQGYIQQALGNEMHVDGLEVIGKSISREEIEDQEEKLAQNVQGLEVVGTKAPVHEGEESNEKIENNEDVNVQHYDQQEHEENKDENENGEAEVVNINQYAQPQEQKQEQVGENNNNQQVQNVENVPESDQNKISAQNQQGQAPIQFPTQEQPILVQQTVNNRQQQQQVIQKQQNKQEIKQEQRQEIENEIQQSSLIQNKQEITYQSSPFSNVQEQQPQIDASQKQEQQRVQQTAEQQQQPVQQHAQLHVEEEEQNNYKQQQQLKDASLPVNVWTKVQSEQIIAQNKQAQVLPQATITYEHEERQPNNYIEPQQHITQQQLETHPQLIEEITHNSHITHEITHGQNQEKDQKEIQQQYGQQNQHQEQQAAQTSEPLQNIQTNEYQGERKVQGSIIEKLQPIEQQHPIQQSAQTHEANIDSQYQTKQESVYNVTSLSNIAIERKNLQAQIQSNKMSEIVEEEQIGARVSSKINNTKQNDSMNVQPSQNPPYIPTSSQNLKAYEHIDDSKYEEEKQPISKPSVPPQNETKNKKIIKKTQSNQSVEKLGQPPQLVLKDSDKLYEVGQEQISNTESVISKRVLAAPVKQVPKKEQVGNEEPKACECRLI